LEVLVAEGVHNPSCMTLIEVNALLSLTVIRVIDSLEQFACLYAKEIIITMIQSQQIQHKYVKCVLNLISISIKGRVLHPVKKGKFNNMGVRDVYVQRTIVNHFSLTMSQHASRIALTQIILGQ
jgi:hypothetical protein